jgi:hypothetical protein
VRLQLQQIAQPLKQPLPPTRLPPQLLHQG